MSEHHHRSSRGFRSDAANDNTDATSPTCTYDTDAATVIGLALTHAREAWVSSPTIPAPVMAQLDKLADRGEPACRMVRNWIRGKAEIISAATSGEVR